MEIGPILSSLRRNKVGATLIALQVALTIGVLCNALFIIEQQTALSRAPSGVADEANVFLVANRWIKSTTDLEGLMRSDLTALRALPQVADVTVSPVQPLGGRGMGMGISLHAERRGSGSLTAVFPVDDHALNTLGLKLIAGRNFRPDEVLVSHNLRDFYSSWGVLIVTRPLARALDAEGNVLGRKVTLAPVGITATIVGIVDRLATGQFSADSAIAQNSILAPLLWVDTDCFYIVRARPGQLASGERAARAALNDISRQRTIADMQSLADARHDFYRGARGEALLMGVICAILLGITALGIVGLTSYWVSQRRRQIGIRRALGATAANILRYFQTENLLIVGAGSALGVILGIAGNLWLVRSMALERLPAHYLLVGTLVVLALGQVAVLWPAARAAAVPPAIAARGP